MIARVEAKQYRCLQSVSQEVGPFQVLVGPNGSGKSVFLDVVSFLSTFMSSGLHKAVEDRSLNFRDLVWRRDGSRFEVAIEARTPIDKDTKIIRYKLAVRLDPLGDELVIDKEGVALLGDGGCQAVVDRNGTSCSFRTETPERLEARAEIRSTYSVLGNVDDRFPTTGVATGIASALDTNRDPGQQSVAKPDPPWAALGENL